MYILLFITIIILIVIFIYLRKEHLSLKNDDSVEIFKLTNIDKYIIYTIPDKDLSTYPLNIMSNFRMFKFNKYSVINIKNLKSENENTTLGFYMLHDPNINHENYLNFLKIKNYDDEEIFSLSTEKLLNDRTKQILTINADGNIKKSSNIVITTINWVVITIEDKSLTSSGNTKNIKININNRQNIEFEINNDKKFNVKEVNFSNFKGYIGRILLFKESLTIENICSKYYCRDKLKCSFSIKKLKEERNDEWLELGDDNAEKCIVKCMEEIGCDVKKCQQICIDCQDEGTIWSETEKTDYCPWYKNIKILGVDVPGFAEIRGFPGDGSILIEWKKPNDGMSPITNYIIDVQETMSKKTSSKIIEIKNNHCEVCEFKIPGLKNQVSYTVSIRAVNSKGIGAISNKINVTPNGIDSQLLKNIDNDINGNFDENERYREYKCMEGYRYNDLSLDLIDYNDIDIERYVKENLQE